KDRTLFLDLETTGLSHYYDDVTLVGTFDGQQSRIFVKDNNLPDLVKLLRNYDILVTFNGKIFDVPFIKKEFPRISLQHVHLDLRFLLRSVGIGGSLKEIEEKLGLHRSREISDVGGRQAAVLWRRFLKGDDEAIRKLVLYNLSDTRNLKTLMDYCYAQKFRQDVWPIINRMKHKEGTDRRILRNPNTVFLSNAVHYTPPRIALKPVRKSLHVFSNGSFLVKIDKGVIRQRNTGVPVLLDKIRTLGRIPSVVGIDLSGSQERPTGICLLSGNTARLSTAFTDKEIIERTLSLSPSVVSIDSPLSLPKGRTCTRDNCR